MILEEFALGSVFLPTLGQQMEISHPDTFYITFYELFKCIICPWLNND